MRFGCLLLMMLASCGGKVVVDAEANGQGGAAGANPSVSSSTSTSTSTATAGGATPGCPDPFPGIGAPCAQDLAQCEVPQSCCITATCTGGIWQASGASCAPACTSCGPNGFGCLAGAVCVINQARSATYKCAANPCDGTPSCGCATPLCDPGFECAAVKDMTLFCDCPNC